MKQSHGDPLPQALASKFEAALGAPLSGTRIHTDPEADRAARLVDARAVATGRDIYFAQGAYRPGTVAGDQLLAHELTHVVQDGRAQAGPITRLSHPGDATESAASAAEQVAAPSATPATASAPPAAPAAGTLHRDIFDDAADWLIHHHPVSRAILEYEHRDDVVQLQGHTFFSPEESLADFIADATLYGGAVPVNVDFGGLARGQLPVFLDEDDRYQTTADTVLSLSLPNLGSDDPSISLKLVLGVENNEVYGIFGGVTAAHANDGAATLIDELQETGSSLLLSWRGLESVDLHHALGQLVGGHLVLRETHFEFNLAGIFSGNGVFGILDDSVTFRANALLHVPGLADGTLELTRTFADGLSGFVNLSTAFPGTAGGESLFHGNLRATFGRGVLDIRGMVRVNGRGFSGSAFLMVTDRASAWNAVNGELAEFRPAAMSSEAPGAAAAAPPAPAAAPAAAGNGTGPDSLAVAGWGLVDFTYANTIAGRAQVIVDPDGEITSIGRVRVVGNVEVFRAREWNSPIFRSRPLELTLASWWDALSIRFRLKTSLDARARLGPAYLRDLHARGVFSTRDDIPTELIIGGTLDLLAFVGFDFLLTGEVVARAHVPLTGGRIGTDVASANAKVAGTASLNASLSATAAIGRRRDESNPRRAHYFLDGRLAAVAHAALSLSGEVDVKVPGHRFHVLDFKRHWPLGSVVRSWAFFNRFKVGEDEAPELQREVDDFSPRAMLWDAIRHEGLEDRPRTPDDHSDWHNSGPVVAVGDEGRDPTEPVIPADPRFGEPTVPPTAPAEVAPLQPGGDEADQPGAAPTTPPPDTGTGAPADAGPPSTGGDLDAGTTSPGGDMDAGVQPAPSDAASAVSAGTPEPEPPPPPPPEPAPAGPTVGSEVPQARDVAFNMEGTPHHLTLEPGHPPVLNMASVPGRLVLKLRIKRDALPTNIPRMPPVTPPAAIETLDALIEEAELVEQMAAQSGFGDRPDASVPGMRELAQHLQAAARQFGWHDLDAYVPTEPSFPPPQEGDAPAPPSQAVEVLRLPFDTVAQPGAADTFLSRVDAMQPAEALPLLREQHRYYSVEFIEVSRYPTRGPQTDLATQIHARRNELSRRIGILIARIRHVNDILYPDRRSKLPCFSPETPVQTPSGPRAIGSLAEGDAVWCFDPMRGRAVVGKVLEVHRNQTLTFYRVRVAGRTVRATARHPFWVEERGDYVPARQLQAGWHVRLLSGEAAEIESVEVEPVPLSPTVDLSISPHPVYFVGPGIRVHNTPPIPTLGPAVRYLKDDGSWISGNYKIYVGLNPAQEFANYVYVGQTSKSKDERQSEHRGEAGDWLTEHPETPTTDAQRRTLLYYQFKQNIRLYVIVQGLLEKVHASYLEQNNIDIERNLRSGLDRAKVLNRREELNEIYEDVEASLRSSTLLIRSGLC